MTPETAHPNQVFRASERDIEGIYQLTLPYVAEKILLPRSREQIQADIERTWVYRQNDEIIGTVSVIFFRKDLCEIRALVVKKDSQGRQIGRSVVEAALQYLRNSYEHKPLRVFALTYVPDFFAKLGFRVTQKENFPDKIYEVCQFCARRDDCREIAVELIINGSAHEPDCSV